MELSEVTSAGMIQLTPEQQPALVWVVDTYTTKWHDVQILDTNEWTNWSHIVLVPRPLAQTVRDWPRFLQRLGEEMLKL